MKELLEELKRSADRRRLLKRSMKAAGVATGAMAMGAGLRTRAVSGSGRPGMAPVLVRETLPFSGSWRRQRSSKPISGGSTPSSGA